MIAGMEREQALIAQIPAVLAIMTPGTELTSQRSRPCPAGPGSTRGRPSNGAPRSSAQCASGPLWYSKTRPQTATITATMPVTMAHHW